MNVSAGNTSAGLSAPFYGPLVLGGITVFAPLIEGGTTHYPILIIRIALLTTLLAWALFSMRAGEIVLHRSHVFPIVVVFLAWTVLLLVWSPYTAVSLQWLLNVLSYVVMLFLVIHLVRTIKQAEGLVKVTLAMGLMEAIIGLYQFMWLGAARPTGTFFNANFFATYEVGVMALGFGLLCFRKAERQKRWESMFLWCTCVAGFVAFIQAQSRGALLALVAAIAFVGFHRFGKVFLATLLVAILALAIIPNPLQKRLTTAQTTDPYAYTRFEIWKNSAMRVADHPWGVGPGIYQYTSFRYRFPVENRDVITHYGKRAESAHNEYLQMTVELGLPGLALFLTGSWIFLRKFRETLKSRLETWKRGLVVGLIGGVIGILTHALTDSVFHEPALVLMLVMFAGLILVIQGQTRAEGISSRVIPFSYTNGRVALITTLGLALAVLFVRPATAWYAFQNGEVEMAADRGTQALKWFQKAAQIDPGISAYHDQVALTLTRLYSLSGDPLFLLNAVEELKIGLTLNPLDGRLANRLGGVLALLSSRTRETSQQASLLSEAETYYLHAIKLDPYSPFNYLDLGKLLISRGRAQEAEEWFRQAIAYEPNFLPIRLQLAQLSLKLGQKTTATSEYEKIVRVRERFRGRILNPLEQKYLDINSEDVKQLNLAGIG